MGLANKHGVQIVFGNETLKDLNVFMIGSLNTIVYAEFSEHTYRKPADWEAIAEWVVAGISTRFYIEYRVAFYHDNGDKGWDFYKVFCHEDELENVQKALDSRGDDDTSAVICISPGALEPLIKGTE